MGRPKSPQETIKLILDVSTELFITKGYENSSIQDIMNKTHLSKGGIYHHFRSKEEIFNTICEELSSLHITELEKIYTKAHLNGAEKLKEIYRVSVFSQHQSTILSICPNFLDNPKLLSMQLKELHTLVAPKFLSPILQEGMNDGSIETTDPLALAEMILILTNIWISPFVYTYSKSAMKQRCFMLNEMLSVYRIQLLDESTIEKLCEHIPETL